MLVLFYIRCYRKSFVSAFKVKIVPSKCNVKMFYKRDNTQYNTSYEFKSGTK